MQSQTLTSFRAICSDPGCLITHNDIAKTQCICGQPSLWHPNQLLVERSRGDEPVSDRCIRDEDNDNTTCDSVGTAGPELKNFNQSSGHHNSEMDKSQLVLTKMSTFTESRLSKPRKPSIPQWCFDCHVSSHWTGKGNCAGILARGAAQFSTAAELGWDSFMMPCDAFAQVKAMKPQNSRQFLNHLQHMRHSIDDYHQMVDSRDAVLKRISEDEHLLNQIGVKLTHNTTYNAYEAICATANKKALHFIDMLSKAMKQLYNDMLLRKVSPTRDLSKLSGQAKRLEIIKCSRKIGDQIQDPAIDMQHAKVFTDTLEKIFADYEREILFLAQDWNNVLNQAVLTDLTDDDADQRLRLRNLPLAEFKIKMVVDSEQSWLPILIMPVVAKDDLMRIAAIYNNTDPVATGILVMLKEAHNRDIKMVGANTCVNSSEGFPSITKEFDKTEEDFFMQYQSYRQAKDICLAAFKAAKTANDKYEDAEVRLQDVRSNLEQLRLRTAGALPIHSNTSFDVISEQAGQKSYSQSAAIEASTRDLDEYYAKEDSIVHSSQLVGPQHETRSTPGTLESYQSPAKSNVGGEILGFVSPQ